MIQSEPNRILKGLNQKPDADVTDGLVECSGVIFDKIGSVKQAKENDVGAGYADAVHSISAEGLLSYDPMLVGAGTSLYVGTSSLKSNFSGAKWSFTAQNGRMYFINQTDGLWYYKGASVYRAGAPVPSSTPSSSAGAAGSLNGTYTIKVTYVNENGMEGNPTALISQNVASQKINLTAIPVNTNADYNITSRRIWVTGGTSPFNLSSYVLAGTLSDNTTTTLTFDWADITTTTVLATDNDLAPYGKWIFEHYGVLFTGNFATNPVLVQSSKVLLGEQWPLANAYTIGRSGDEAMMGVSWNGSAWVVTRKKVTQIIGSPGNDVLTANFYLKDTQAVSGTIAGRSVVPTPYGLFYQAEDGIRIFDGDKSHIFSQPIQTIMQGRDTRDAVESLSVGAFFDDKLWLSFAEAGQSAPSTTVVYDFQTETWRVHPKGYSDFFADKKNKVLYGARGSNLERVEFANTYSAWALKTKDYTAGRVDTLGVFDKFAVDMRGECIAQVYYDDAAITSYSLSAPTRKLLIRRFPPGISQRCAVRLSGSAGTSQTQIFGFTYKAEPTRGEI